MIKTATLLFACILFLSTNSSAASKDMCDTWFPEPLTDQNPVKNSQFTSGFLMIDDLISDKNEEEWKRVSRQYIAKSVKGHKLGFFEWFGILLRNLPSYRNLIISFTCLLIAKILFSIVLYFAIMQDFCGLINPETLDKYRIAFTSVPVVCVISLMLLSDHLQYANSATLNGIHSLDTRDDKNFMPVKDRIRKNLDTLKCKFEKTFTEEANYHLSVLDPFLQATINASYKTEIDMYNTEHTTGNLTCDDTLDDVEMVMSNFFSTNPLGEVLRHITLLNNEYVVSTKQQMDIAFSVFSTALGSIEEFVERIHEDVLQVPSEASIIKYMTLVVFANIFTAGTCVCFVVVSVMKFRLTKVWLIVLAYVSIGIVVFISTLFVICFLGIVSKISFILLTQSVSGDTEFNTIFKSSQDRVFSADGFSYSVNYVQLLNKCHKEDTTLLGLLDANYKKPVALDGHRLWKPSEMFNETLELLDGIVANFKVLSQKVCDEVKELRERVEALKRDSGCDDTVPLNTITNLLQNEQWKLCNATVELRAKLFPTKAQIRRRSLEFWKKTLIPVKNVGVVDKESMFDNYNAMQIYLVFTKPAMRLRSSVLEPWKGIADLMLAMAPLHFVIAVYLMFVAELHIDNGDGVEHDVKDCRVSWKCER